MDSNLPECSAMLTPWALTATLGSSSLLSKGPSHPNLRNFGSQSGCDYEPSGAREDTARHPTVPQTMDSQLTQLSWSCVAPGPCRNPRSKPLSGSWVKRAHGAQAGGRPGSADQQVGSPQAAGQPDPEQQRPSLESAGGGLRAE